MSHPLLQIKSLSVDFVAEQPTSALKNISFEVNKGEVVAIVGESGSGKTVTSLSILQLLPSPPAKYVSGEILFSLNDDTPVDLLKLSPSEIRKIRGNDIAMIFQEPMTSLNPVLTCGRQVREAVMLHRNKTKSEAKQLTIELFDKVKLPDPEAIYKRYPHQLSGGQKQRIMIAMAMSCNPALLIADEPTTALDVTVQQTILDLLKQLQTDTDMSIIYITHDLNLIAGFADRVVVMYKGEIVEQGPVKQVFSSPQHEYTQRLLGLNRELSVVKSRPAYLNEVVPIVSVKGLTVSFPVQKNLLGKTIKKITAVDDVSFSVMRGETLGLVGESGSGKTTLGRALIRLVKPSSGQIIFEGKDIAALSDEELRRIRKDIQIIFQDPYGSLNPRITIGNAIQEPLKVHGMLDNDRQRKDRVMDLLEKVKLSPEHFNRYPHQFSGGQRQRICIARALGMNPDFLICDESVSALDISVQAQVLQLLSDLKKELGFTCVFISHDLNVVRYISDRIMVMNKGRIVETGTADDIYYNPQDAYTQRLIAAIPPGIIS